MAFLPVCLPADANDVNTPDRDGYVAAADPGAVVVAGNARFTVLTSRLIRMEWSQDASFEDRATLSFVNRRLPVPEYKVARNGSKLVIRTADVTLTYKGPGKFDKSNLSVQFKMNGKKVIWHYGDDESGNLMGTVRTLDRADGNNFGKGDKMEPGVLSRDGWAVVDDSRRHVLDPVEGHWESWVQERPEGDRQDLYMFAYGHAYRDAMRDFSKVAGRAPMPPRYTFGYWWSRYWQYSDSEFRDLIERLRGIGIPVDVLIIDMDWHDTWTLGVDSPKDEFGQRIGWTGYTWQKELFPNPENFLRWTNENGLGTALNLHPASGIQPYEAVYEDFVKDYGWDQPGKPVPFKMDELKWADSYFKTVLEPNEKSGVDFWWLDWQQWLISKDVPGLSNTFWLNHTFFKHAQFTYPDKRPFLYHRWGGLGSHRYPLAFSGDTFCTWASLEYQPEFTATSANVNYGYWGHDLGGHFFRDNNKETTNPEQFTRWLQYGVFTPIFKVHPSKHPNLQRYFWLFPDYLFTMLETVRMRYRMVPYIYNASRRNYDTGIAMCHPLYYDYPDDERAYSYKSEVFFGEDIITTSVFTPVDGNGISPVKMWFPSGNDWFDMTSGSMHKGDTESVVGYTIEEQPWFAKAGSVIPMYPDGIKTLHRQCDTLVLTMVPGADGSLEYYEDDGVSQKYKTEYSVTSIVQKRGSDGVKLTIDPRKGTYDGASAVRSYQLRFPMTPVPVSVKVNGREIPYDRYAGAGEWTYDGPTLSPVVLLDDMPVDKPIEVELAIRPEDMTRTAELDGLIGLFGRCKVLSEPFKMTQGMKDRYKMLPKQYLAVSQCPNFITEDPGNLFKYVETLHRSLKEFKGFLGSYDLVDESFKTMLRARLGIEEPVSAIESNLVY